MEKHLQLMENTNKKENICTAFKGFNSHSDDYLGALYIQIMHDLPVCYRVFFNKQGKLSYKTATASFGYRAEIDNKIDERFLMNKALEAQKTDDNLSVFAYSSNSWLIISQNTKNKFMINITLSEEGSVSAFYEELYTNDVENAFEYISSWFKPIDKEDKSEFGIAAIDSSNSLYTNWYDYSYPPVDIKKNYNDDIPYEKMCECIESSNKPELMLFYGEAGTGKSTLIKHFISKYNEKDFVFIDGTLLANSSQERLMSYFLENQNTVFILEDCEKVLMDRENYFNPVMPLILNITDGVISDVLGIKLICTFNTKLSKIDPALLRKGRLSLKYEFKKLTKDKAEKLLDSKNVTGDMSLAEIYFQDENDFSKKKQTKMGF